MAKKLTKAEENLLRDYAAKMPMVLENTLENHLMTGLEVKQLRAEYGEECIKDERIKMQDDKKYHWAMPVQIAANHYRRLKKAWFKDGQKGLSKYISKIVELANQNKADNAGQ